MLKRDAFRLSLLAGLFVGTAASAQSPRAIYTWNGTGNAQGWFKNFGTNTITLANSVAGELTVTETGTAGTGVAISDDFNGVFEGAARIGGGIDLTGLSSLEIDMGHNGVGPVNVQFFVQASPGSNYVALGPDQAIAPGIATYSMPLSGLTSDQIVYVRTIGINIRDHLGEGNLTWTLQEVRSAGTPLVSRVYASHEPGTSDGGLQGAYVNFENSAVAGNSGSQDQSGLTQNTSASPPGNTGSLHWKDLGTENGAAVTWVNGTALAANPFNEGPTDMSNYRGLQIRMAARNTDGGSSTSLNVQYFLQTGNYDYHTAGPDQSLPVDGQFHTLCFPIQGIANLDFVVAHGVNLQNHPGGNLLIDIDSVSVSQSVCLQATPAVSLPVAIALGLLCAGLGGLFLARRRQALLAR
jgi:hypothetical protein